MKKLIYLAIIILTAACSNESPQFERLSSEQTGISFINTITESDSFNILNNEYMYNGGGVGIADLNNDGLQDVIFTGNQVSSRVYLNQGDFKFLDITDKFENLTNDQWYSGVAIADINGDGWVDVYITSTTNKDPEKRRNRLWIHQGLGDDGMPRFTEESSKYGVDDEGYSVHAGFLDYDLDGDLDLYVLNNIVNQQIPTNYRPKITDGTAINNDQFYENMGDGTFQKITEKAGIVYEGFGLGLAIGDVNKDGYPDIYVSNDYISNDLLYINQQDGTFLNQSPEYFSYQSKFSMGNDMADINNDGYSEIMTLDMLPEKYSRKKQTINGNSYFFYVNDEKYGYQHQYVRNMVFQHNGFHDGNMLPYSEVGQIMGVFETEWSWSPLFADYDNDGDRDLLITNGFPKDLTDKDFTNYKADVHGFVASDRQVIAKIPIVKVSNYAYENLGEFSFADKTVEWGLEIPSFSNGAAFVDLDNDGDLDYLVNNIDDEAFIYENTQKNNEKSANYIQLKLEGEASNTSAIGAKIEIWAGGEYQFHEQFLTRGYLSSVTPVVHFGLKNYTVIDSLRIIWPKGDKQTILTEVMANQIIQVSEPDGEIIELRNNQSISRQTLFTKKDSLLPYLHQQTDYIDFFQYQRVIQHKFSQIGPCLAQGDLNNDGLEDVIIGASDQLPTTVFVQTADGHFSQAELEGLTNAKVCSEADLIVMDIEQDGDQDVIAVSGGYINEEDSAYKHYLYINEGGTFLQQVLPIPSFSASTIKVKDFDHDGDEDLFIGSRVEKGRFPHAKPSFILINEDGKFIQDPALSFDIGMVTDAVWSDVDGDGWEDILVAREWNSLILLKNKDGKEFVEVQSQSLESKHGLWSGLVAVDLDGDGDEDFIAGNLGDNHRFNISDAHPLRLYAMDIDQNGVIDPITSGYWKDDEGVMQEYPINYLDELAAQSIYFRKMFTSYTLFSQTPIREIFKDFALSDSLQFHVNTTSSYIIWNDHATFRWEKLPEQLQVAPIKEMIAKDFDGDQNVDVLITGNDHTYDVSTGYYDANKGLILRSAGKGNFTLLSPSESGIYLQGQVESLLYIDGETPFVIAGINRGKLTVFRHK